VIPSGLLQKNFDNCHIGIDYQAVNTSILGIRFADVEHGVIGANCLGTTHDMRKCTFRTKRSAVFMSNHTSEVQIEDNSFYSSVQGGAAPSNVMDLRLERVNCQYNGARCIQVKNNLFHTKNSNFGLRAFQCRGLYIYGNQAFNFAETASPQLNSLRHYSIANCNRPLFTCNSAQNDNLSNIGMGLHVVKTQQGLYRCNHFAYNRTGTQFAGLNEATRFDLNTFTFNSRTGLELTAKAVIGKQVNKGNLFEPSTFIGNYRPARHLSQDEEFVNLSQFIVSNTLQIGSPAYPQSQSVSNTWFNPQNVGPTPQTCEAVGSCPEGEPTLLIEPSEVDNLIATGDLSSIVNYEQWQVYRRRLYERLSQNIPVSLSQPLVDFLEEDAVDNYRNFDSLAQVLRQLAVAESTNYATGRSYLDSVLVVEKAIGDFITEQTSSCWQDSTCLNYVNSVVDSFYQVQKSYSVQSRVYFEAQKQERELYRTGGYVLNESLLPNSVNENYERLMNRLYLNTVFAGIDSFTTEEWALIELLSTKCAETHGEAVYMAAVLRGQKELDYVYEESIDCVEPDFEFTENRKSNRLASWSLLPNPAQDYTNLVVENFKEGDVWSLKVTNMVGQDIETNLQNSSDTGVFVLQTSDWVAGVYFLTFVKNGVPQGTKSLIVQKN
jgi:hypothetical protein